MSIATDVGSGDLSKKNDLRFFQDSQFCSGKLNNKKNSLVPLPNPSLL